MKQNSLSAIRRQNLRRMLDLLTLEPSMTRQALAEGTGLSLMSVTNLVDVLKEQGVLRFSTTERRGMGRKADDIALSGREKAWLFVDLSGRQLHILLTGFDLLPLLQESSTPGEDYLGGLKALLHTVRAQLPEALDGRELLGVAVVTPGPYEIASDTVINQRIPALNGVKIKALFQEHLGAYDYYVDEDVKFAVRAFSGPEGQQEEVLYYLYLGEGVGGSAVVNGNMLRGLNATAGDAGQLTDRSGKPYEGRLDLAAYARELGLEEGTSPEAQQQALIALAKDDPHACRAALARLAAVAAEMLHDVMWMLDPSRVVIDCRYARPFAEEFIRQVEQQLRTHFEGTSRRLPVIVAAPQNVPSILRGAVKVLQKEWLARIGC